MGPASSRQPKIFRVFLAIAIFGGLGIGVFLVLLKSWTTTQESGPQEAGLEIERLLEEMEDSRPYLVMSKGGEMVANRQLESDDAAPVQALCFMVWNPKREGWVQINYPYWFVRMKMRSELSVTLLHAIVKEDWSHLLVDIQIADFERRGPGLILHEKRPNGREILVWNSGVLGNRKSED